MDRQEECAANARLIAAAPDLFEAAVAVVERWVRLCETRTEEDRCCGRCPIGGLDAAIRLALEGRGASDACLPDEGSGIKYDQQEKDKDNEGNRRD